MTGPLKRKSPDQTESTDRFGPVHEFSVLIASASSECLDLNHWRSAHYAEYARAY